MKIKGSYYTTIIFIIVLLFGTISFGSYFAFAYSSLRTPGGSPAGLPMQIKIPSIGVDAAVEDAYVTETGRMDSPEGIENVAWFALGPNPGEVGSAVIGGHYGIKSGARAVFYNLDKLKKGDLVHVTNDKGETISFVVRSFKVFDREDSAKTVFTSRDGLAHLNLISCEGDWNEAIDTYQKRRVVFTDRVYEETDTAAAAASLLPALNTLDIPLGFQTEPVNPYLISIVGIIGTILLVGLLIFVFRFIIFK